MKRLILVLLMLLAAVGAEAQLRKIEVGVNGLTCSQCSRSVYKKLSHLDFIDKIDMDLNTHASVITVKNPKNYNVDLIAQAVIDAGYSVRHLILFFEKNEIEFYETHFESAGQKFYFNNIDNSQISSPFQVELIGKKYNSNKKLNKLLPEGFFNQMSKSYFVVFK